MATSTAPRCDAHPDSYCNPDSAAERSSFGDAGAADTIAGAAYPISERGGIGATVGTTTPVSQRPALGVIDREVLAVADLG